MEIRDLSGEIALKGLRRGEPVLIGYVLEHFITQYAQAIREHDGHQLAVTFQRLDELFRDLQRDAVMFSGGAVQHEVGAGRHTPDLTGQKDEHRSGLAGADDMRNNGPRVGAQQAEHSYSGSKAPTGAVDCQKHVASALGRQCMCKLNITAGCDFPANVHVMGTCHCARRQSSSIAMGQPTICISQPTICISHQSWA